MARKHRRREMERWLRKRERLGLPPGVGAVAIYALAAAVSPVGAAVLGAPIQLTIL